jgi:hypothetical protein
MSMSRKHYTGIARAIAATEQVANGGTGYNVTEALDSLAITLAAFMAEDNARFDVDRFYLAARPESVYRAS